MMPLMKRMRLKLRLLLLMLSGSMVVLALAQWHEEAAFERVGELMMVGEYPTGSSGQKTR